MPTFDDLPGWLDAITGEQPYPLVFTTISGAHLYGFASVDSDVDLRGVHILPIDQVVGLNHGPETLQHMGMRDGVELDLVTHDLLKFCRLLLKTMATWPSNCSRHWSLLHHSCINIWWH